MWHIEVASGRAEEFHQRALPAPVEPTVWWFDVSVPALILGSSQPMDHVDLGVCASRGVDVVRRRSGGGAVLLLPGDALWVDVIIPPTHSAWTDDVGQSAWWLGEVWTAALDALGVRGGVVHRGAMVRTAWSGHVCFAGVGGGEVMRGGRKAVGISQRRSRDGARFQCALYRRWDAAAHAELFRPPGPTVADLAGLADEVTAADADVRAAFVTALTTVTA